jgi:hypothetical protein
MDRLSSGNPNNKAIIYGLAAAGALITGAILFNYLSNKTSSASSSSDVLAEIEALGPPKKSPNGLLTFPYYKDIFMLISKHSKLKFAVEKKELLKKRREASKSGNKIEYKEIVKELI